MSRKKIIGVVGGVGPYAGLDLVRKIFDQTKASTDQEHLSVILISLPDEIEDRTGFLLGKSEGNPGRSIYKVVKMLERAGAAVVGIPCNTAHAPSILGGILKKLRKDKNRPKLLNLIRETVGYLSSLRPKPHAVGVLSTTGTKETRIYRTQLEKQGFSVTELDDKSQADLVQDAIYNTTHGIKARSNPVTDVARSKIEAAMALLLRRGVDVIILGCTELPLAIPYSRFERVPLVDPSTVLARALIRAVDKSKLKPM